MKVCANCFQDQEIRQFINSTSTERGNCDYCSEESALLDIEELLDFFKIFFSIFRGDFGYGAGKPLIDLIQEDWKIVTNRDIGAAMLSDIFQITFGMPISDKIKHQYAPEIEECVHYWNELKQALKWERRFLTDAELLDEYGWSSLFNINAEIDSNINLYRARIHKNGETNPIVLEEMSSPPKEKATAGRANPCGIPYLYLSKTPQTTLYETRSSYLDTLSIGRFVVCGANLKIVDFTSHPSPFNHMDDMWELAQSKFLKRAISADLSKPLRRFDSELEYIPTQFICEFIRYSTGADGIQFNSSLDEGGVNIVLFDPSKVKCIEVELHQIVNVHIQSKKLSSSR